MNTSPNYARIYEDMMKAKSPEKFSVIEKRLNQIKNSLSVVRINQVIIKNELSFRENQKSKVYDESSIMEVLQYQSKMNLNNSQTADYFKISRNTIAKWKNIYFNVKLN